MENESLAGTFTSLAQLKKAVESHLPVVILTPTILPVASKSSFLAFLFDRLRNQRLIPPFKLGKVAPPPRSRPNWQSLVWKWKVLCESSWQDNQNAWSVKYHRPIGGDPCKGRKGRWYRSWGAACMCNYCLVGSKRKLENSKKHETVHLLAFSDKLKW